MVEVNCLYLANLPRRPGSNDHFIRLLLKHINSDNQFASNPSVPLPANEPLGNGPLHLLDESFGILQISRSVRLQNQCFITFVDPASASGFKAKFGHGWRIHGRLIDVQYVNKNSLMGLAVLDQGLLQHVLKKRRIKHKMSLSEDLISNQRLKRKLRRLRCKLRRKGLSSEEINDIVETRRNQKPKASGSEIKRSREKPAPTTRENPPNKVLLVQNLPHDTTLETITEVFQSKALVEIRLVMVRKLAFVEYESIEAATTMRDKLGTTYTWNDHQINIEFAK